MRRRMETLKEALMIAAAACLVVGLAPGAAQAQQCGVGGNYYFGPHYYVRGNTYALGSCDFARVEARAWLELWDDYLPCDSGTYVGGKCEMITYGQSEAIAEFNAQMCGRWYGTTQHIVRNRYNFGEVYEAKQYRASLGGIPCRRTEQEQCESWETMVDGVGCVPYNSPILVPLTRSQDYHLTSVDDGVKFDWDGNGVPEQTAWTAANSRLAFLAIDMDNDGKITSGRELAGDRLVDGKDNGWEALIALAPPDVSVLDNDHELFRRLLLWEDRNHDGVSQESELQPASNVLAQLGLGYIQYNRRDGHGNKFMFQGRATVRTAPGKNPTTSHENMVDRNIKLYDVFFVTQR